MWMTEQQQMIVLAVASERVGVSNGSKRPVVRVIR
jgi:hypothetical protein